MATNSTFSNSRIAERKQRRRKPLQKRPHDHPASACQIVRKLVQQGKTGARQIARETGVSKRTLQRRLAETGQSFSTIVKEEQMARAIALIKNTNIKLGFIARELGYANPANFVRAFRKWTGVSPSRFRARTRPIRG